MSLSGIGWAKWCSGLRCVLFAHAAMYVANAPMLAFADEIMRQVTPTNDSKPERYSVDISKNLQVIPVNIGKHLVGKIAKVEVSLKNTLDSDLDLVAASVQLYRSVVVEDERCQVGIHSRNCGRQDAWLSSKVYFSDSVHGSETRDFIRDGS